jgi:hypothetical protein
VVELRADLRDHPARPVSRELGPLALALIVRMVPLTAV